MYRSSLARHWVTLAVVLLAAAVGATAGADPVVLDNARIRIEIDTELFTVRFVGAPGGRNLVEPLPISKRARWQRATATEPGGLGCYVVIDGRTIRAGGRARSLNVCRIGPWCSVRQLPILA